MRRETSLDPASPADWVAMRAARSHDGRRHVRLSGARAVRPAWQPIPAGVKSALAKPAPEGDSDPAEVYAEFVENVLPYTTGNIHPRFWGWVMGNGTPFGMLAEMLAAAMNPNVPGGEQSPAYVEHQVISWLRGHHGISRRCERIARERWLDGEPHLSRRRTRSESGPRRGNGSGGRDAHARHVLLDRDAQLRRQVREALGLGKNNVRKIRVGADYRIDLGELERAIVTDKAAGLRSVLHRRERGHREHRRDRRHRRDGGHGREVRDVAARRWCVRRDRGDLAGAGAAARRHVARRLHRVRSAQMDVHAVRRRLRDDAASTAHRAAFTPGHASYLALASGGLVSAPLTFSETGMELSRSFLALKVWMSIKEHGLARYRAQIEQNVAQARYLESRVKAAPALEMMAPVPLNIVCFRYVSRAMDDAELDALNAEVVVQLQERGIAVPSGTVLGGRYAIRVANTNHRSRMSDFDLLTDAVVEIGDELRARRKR